MRAPWFQPTAAGRPLYPRVVPKSNSAPGLPPLSIGSVGSPERGRVPLSKATTVIYVVDDDESVRKSLCRLLRSMTFEVESFASGAQLLARLPLVSDGIVILDLRMPVLNGLDVQRELRARGAAAPVIFITAHEDDEARETAMASGAIGFVRKPFDESVLMNLVEYAVAHCAQAAAAVAMRDASRRASGP